MATHSSSLPFTLRFIQREQTFQLDSNCFVSDEEELYTNERLTPISILEYIEVDVLFDCDHSDARFYMDGLDSLPEREVEEDAEGNVYLPPSPDRVGLFRHDYYPLIPGVYRLMVCIGDERYYASIRVAPKQISQMQWEQMRDEVEKEVRGLAHDLIRSNLGLGFSFDQHIPVIHMYRFLVMRNYFSQLVAAVSDLYTKVNSRIEKGYKMVPVERTKSIDEVTVRHRLRHPENKLTLKSPFHKVKYDLPENRWLKKIMETMMVSLREFIEATSVYQGQLAGEIRKIRAYAEFQNSSRAVLNEKQKVMEQLQSYLEMAARLRKVFDRLKSAHWYEEISPATGTPLPSVMTLDSRYRVLYQVYRELKNEASTVRLEESYSFQWKRTDKLYEIWGFIKIIKALYEELGYKPVQGWLFSSDYGGQDVLIPALQGGTRILYQKDDLELHLIYEGFIPLTSRETKPDYDPLFMSATQNWPDGRLDVYNKGCYIGSLLFDFKYRPLRYIWNEHKVKTRQRTDAMRQLITYSTSCRSVWLFGDTSGMFSSVNPVQEVWALYPVASETGEAHQKFDDHGVRVVRLSPGMDNSHMTGILEDGIAELLARYSRFLGSVHE